MDYYEEKPKKGFTVWKLIKWLLAALTIAVYVLLTLRACALEHMEDTAKTRKYLWNEISLASYTADPEAFSLGSYEPINYITSDGRLTITNIRYHALSGQLQFTLRYNNSLARDIEEDYALDEEPTGEFLTFILRDDLGNIYTSYQYISDSAFVYNYRRLIFDGVSLEGVSSVYVEAYYIGYADFDNSTAAVEKLIVYDAAEGYTPYELKNNELPSGALSEGLVTGRVWIKTEEN